MCISIDALAPLLYVNAAGSYAVANKIAEMNERARRSNAITEISKERYRGGNGEFTAAMMTVLTCSCV